MKTIIQIIILTAIIIVPVHADERPDKKAFKGFELYSWQNSEGGWFFALLPGTNRLKTETEIKETKNIISGTKELESRFTRLGVGENVYWFNSDSKGFKFPDDTLIKEIILSAKSAKIELHLPQK